MKNAIVKTFLFLITLLLLAVISFLGYSTYSIYKGFHIAQNANSYILDIKQKDQTLRKLELERIQSSLYLGYDGKVAFKNLEDSRVQTDKDIEKNQKTLEALQYVRSRVDVISDDYKSILFDYYQKELMDKLLAEIKEKVSELSFGVNTLKDDLQGYEESITKRNNLNQQRSFLTFVLSSSKKMDDDELLLWEKILQHQPSQKYHASIIRGAITGDYRLNINQWFQTQTKKELDLQTKQAEILHNIKSNIPYTKTYPDAFKYTLIALLFSILLLFMSIRALKKRSYAKTVIHNKHIVRKNPRTDEEFDMPLSNMAKQTTFSAYGSDKNLKTFNPMEEFLVSTKHFIKRSAKKKITFNYFIDPTIPTLCIGEIDKIKTALDHLVNYVIATSKSKKTLRFRIENIASTKFESAIRFSIEDEHSQFTKEEKRQILRIVLQSQKDKSTSFDDIKDDLIYINELIHTIGGIFKIDDNQPNGSVFHITINFKKTDSNETLVN